jgi:hypothetical protein
MKKFIKKIFGIEKLEEEKQALLEARDKAIAETVRAQEAEELAKLSPKERATAKNEPWVSVLNTHVNKENIRNGFFELDWNEQFILQLKQAGYGFEGDPDEEIVDRWFRELALNMLAEAGVSEPNRHNAGYINVTKLAGGKAQIE